MGDYIPTNDADLLNFAGNFKAKLTANKTALGLATTIDEDIIDRVGNFTTILAAHNAAQNAARSARETKDAGRGELVSTLRSLAKQLQANPAMTNALRAEFGITIADAVPSYVPVPTTKPVLIVDPSQRLKHSIAFSDEATPTVRAKPKGAHGAEIFMSIGANAPTQESDWTFLALDTATPYEVQFNESDGGKKVYYQARWVNRAGDKGVWSAVVSSTIVA